MDTQAALGVYRDLADHYERQGQPSMRDRFLVLAADAALASGSAAEAERFRQRLLQVNPHHLLKPYKSFAEAIRAPDVQIYVRDLRQNYPLETAENLLRSLRAENLLNSLREETVPAAPKARPASAAATPQAEVPVYRLRAEDSAPLKPRSAAVPQYSAPCRVPQKPAAPKGPPLAQPVAKPPVRPVASARAPRAAAPGPDAPAGGAWFASALFGFFIVACAALAAYTLARPFLPPEWLP